GGHDLLPEAVEHEDVGVELHLAGRNRVGEVVDARTGPLELRSERGRARVELRVHLFHPLDLGGERSGALDECGVGGAALRRLPAQLPHPPPPPPPTPPPHPPPLLAPPLP